MFQFKVVAMNGFCCKPLNGLQLSYNSNLSCLSCPDFSRDTYDCIPNDSDNMTIVCFENGFERECSLRAVPDSKGSKDCATSNQSLLRPLRPFSRFLGK
jgi:hypothetical protein